MGAYGFDDFEEYLDKSKDAIELFGDETDFDLKPFYHKEKKERCFENCNGNRTYCDKWYIYSSKCSNELYEDSYYEEELNTYRGR